MDDKLTYEIYTMLLIIKEIEIIAWDTSSHSGEGLYSNKQTVRLGWDVE